MAELLFKNDPAAHCRDCGTMAASHHLVGLSCVVHQMMCVAQSIAGGCSAKVADKVDTRHRINVVEK